MNTIKTFLKKKFPILGKIKYITRAIISQTSLKYFELHIVDHCNLKCKGCTHFANISGQYFIDGRILEYRLLRLNYIFAKINKVRILGGEPLLHPDIANILKVVRKSLPYCDLELVTNGLLLDKMTEKFFKTCYENRILLLITAYPDILKRKKNIEKVLSDFKIKYDFSPAVFTFTANLNPKGNSDKKETFENCKHTYCTILKDDNIYICPICAYIDKYNEYFNKTIPQGKGINIFKNTAKDILNYLSNAEETCKYCTNNTNYINWTCSNSPDESDWNGKI